MNQWKVKYEFWTDSNHGLDLYVAFKSLGDIFTDSETKADALFIEFSVVHDFGEVCE